MELKKPFHTQMHDSANDPVRVPSMVLKSVPLITSPTRPAMTADIGITFQSLWNTNILKNLPR